ncbi:two-component regulator propeller domain-containing protein [Psychroserpens sp. SPM9]|uniref:ligand-binding sensor domain-containing protein n=1 Tax=Psychroserpens sp. SPM9 TaxID=2975598 RepID=UPI0021A6BD5D|nr:two-component regulator propeller domain-containing protein [Psychroserpens sp. SPM9]MDG5493238.1 two-component regulator propeller domain-containing protein [Psychroserpens sp. SPM9]
MNINSIKIFLLIFISSTFLSCNGQEKIESKIIKTKSFEFGKTVSNLADRIWVIFQDSKENYWFGSNGEGIFHLNEKDLKQITTENGLVNNTIRGIQEDKSGNIFIETANGISKYDGKSLTTLKPIVSAKNKWKLEPNDLWFGYNANDLYRYDGDSLFELKLPRQNLKKTFGIDTLVSPFNNNNLYSVYKVNKDKDGNIWFGTFVAGAFRYDGQSFMWFGENELSILPNGTAPGVRSILQDKDGYFWLSNFISKYQIEPQKLVYDKIIGIEKDNPYYFNSGLSDINGDLWMTNYGGMVWKYDGKTLSEIEINNEEKDVLLITIYQDNNGIIWLGTDNDGVYKSNGKSFEKFEPNN